MTTRRVNAALVRYAGGHLYVDVGGTGNRIETYIEMGQVADRDAAEGLARAFLVEASTATSTYAATGETRSIDTVPGLGLRLGDAVAGAGVPFRRGDLVERPEHRDLDLVAAVHAGLLPAPRDGRGGRRVNRAGRGRSPRR